MITLRTVLNIATAYSNQNNRSLSRQMAWTRTQNILTNPVFNWDLDTPATYKSLLSIPGMSKGTVKHIDTVLLRNGLELERG
jgi:hypothetical protein